MMKNNVAFLTTIFPMNKIFLKDFFKSLNYQTYQKFDLVIINDGFKDLHRYKREFFNLNIVEVESSSSPSKNREKGINYCIEQNYDIIIFGDSDDYFAHNRIEKSIELLRSNDIVVNDFSLFNEDGIYEKNYISHRVENNTIIDIEFIQDKNIFGLTNTAINLESILPVVFDEKVAAPDWIFFKTQLKKGLKAIFTNETISYYRQYDNNTVGLRVEDDFYYFWWEKR